MNPFFKNDVIDENLIIKNSEPKKFFTNSKNGNKSPIPSISYSSIISDEHSNLNLNSCFGSSDNSFNELKYTYNNLSNKKNNKQNEENVKNTFLGKKTKIHFNVLKKCEKKRIFETTIYYRKNEHNINNITSNNLSKDENQLNRQNSQSLESTLSIKEEEKNETVEKCSQKTTKKLFNIIDYNLFEDFQQNDINEGRWSFKEHIKFIKAFVYFGKKYKLTQQYISSRSCKQIRSHAQKFVLKLKSLKYKDYDFSKSNINSLSDIIDIIQASNNPNIKNKEYIINTLIDISEKILKNGDNIKLKKLKNNTGIIKTDENAFINDSVLNNNNGEIKKEINDKNLRNKLNNEIKNINIFEKEELNGDIINSDINLMRNDNLNIYKEELSLDINNNIYIELNEDNAAKKEEIITKGLNYYEDINNLENILNQNDIFDEDFVSLPNDSCWLCQDEFPSEIKDNLIMKNYLKLISNLYS